MARRPSPHRTVLALGLVLAPLTGAAELSPQETRGREIYHYGRSTVDRELWAAVGPASVRLPAHAVPCAGCHGTDGLGRREGGVVPPPIRWSELAKDYSSARRRPRPSYDEAGVALAITRGVRASGDRLDPAMPRYAMSESDLADLIAYLKRIEADDDPGIDATTVRIGVLMPSDPVRRATARAMLAALETELDGRLGANGANGRRVVLVKAEAADGGGSAQDAATTLLEGGVFALIATYPEQAVAVAGMVRDAGVPLLTPVAPPAARRLDGEIPFALFPSLGTELAALLQEARRRGGNGGAVLVHMPGLVAGIMQDIEDAQASTAHAAPRAALLASSVPADVARLADTLAAEGAAYLLYMGPPDALNLLLAEAATRNWHPTVLLPGFLLAGGIGTVPPAFDSRILVSVPALQLAATRTTPAEALGRVLGGVLAEGLRRPGRNLSRTRFVDALERIDGLETGLAPPLAFGPNRRLGLTGTYVGRLDPIDGQVEAITWALAP